MKAIRNGLTAIVMLGCVFGSAQAAPVLGLGAGYHGSAQLGNPQGGGIGVGPYSSWSDCNTALQTGINYAVNQNRTILSIVPCHYRSNYTENGFIDAYPHEFVLPVHGHSPDESLQISRMLSDEISRLRTEYRIDDYDAALQAIEKSAGIP